MMTSPSNDAVLLFMRKVDRNQELLTLSQFLISFGYSHYSNSFIKKDFIKKWKKESIKRRSKPKD